MLTVIFKADEYLRTPSREVAISSAKIIVEPLTSGDIFGREIHNINSNKLTISSGRNSYTASNISFTEYAEALTRAMGPNTPVVDLRPIQEKNIQNSIKEYSKLYSGSTLKV